MLRKGDLHSKPHFFQHFISIPLTLIQLHIFVPPLTEVWDYFHSTLLKEYASIYNGINVVTGPVFDYNYDGQYDTQEQNKQ